MTAMGLKIYAGRTFHLRPPSSSKPHLYVALTNPDGYPEETVIIVNFTSLESARGNDTRLILNRGEHSFIKHETTVNYLDVLIPKVADIQAAIKGGYSTFGADCSYELLEKIQVDALGSKYLSEAIKRKIRQELEY